MKLTGIFLDVFCKDLMVSFVHLIFQVYKWLKSRVQPQTSFLTTKKPIMELFFLFFLHFIVSSSLFIMFVFFSGFNWRLNRHASEISRSSVHFCCGYLFFWVCQPNCYFSWIFLQRSNVFFCLSYFSGREMVEMKSTTTYIFFFHQKTHYGDVFSIFLSFHLSSSLFIMFVFFSGFNWRLKRHASEISRSSVHFCCGYLFFLFVNLTGIFLQFFYKDLMFFFLHLIFQLHKWLKSRVQPSTSEISLSSVHFCSSSLNFFVS